MPPHLHPRSTATSTLFAGTLLASFVVIGIPHLFPCPRPRTGYADTEPQLDEHGQPIIRHRRSRRRTVEQEDQHAAAAHTSKQTRKGLSQRKDVAEEAALFEELRREAEALEREARECPVPKPSGLIGRLLGFDEKRAPSPSIASAQTVDSGGGQGKS